MTYPSRRADAELAWALDAQREAAEARLLEGTDGVHLAQVAGEEPMVCDFREESGNAVQ